MAMLSWPSLVLAYFSMHKTSYNLPRYVWQFEDIIHVILNNVFVIKMPSVKPIPFDDERLSTSKIIFYVMLIKISLN